ncbi:peptidoglycan DD-metalloendopeptidase family protein [Trichloromonas sp.]|uniref:M23 family metallopeptidase n=1 Tax=Trichloromonas sp. TaxID=3069249 RepID=UPI003D814B41
MDFDFNTPRIMARSRRKKKRTPLLLMLLALVGTIFLLTNRQSVTPTEARVAPVEATIQAAPPISEIQREILEGAISPGDTITSLLSAYFSPREIHELGQQSRGVFPLSNICAGQPYKICLSDGSFEQFEYDIDRDDQLIIRHGEEGFDVERIAIDYTVETGLIEGTITSSLFEAVADIGESAELAMNLADIFAWDINFILDIRAGDSFKALVEKRFREGQPAGYGRILAAEFTNQGETFRAFLFKDGDNPASYYDANGKSLRKAFLKAPLAFSRISSGFTMKRFHPISKTWKAHPAIDYAAPTGTPIKAVGDATIIKIGYTQYNGNFIKLRHNNSYETLYLHMSRFGKGMKQGKKVSQGTVIGYVGSTGLATGPHLCFRMFQNGTPVNPYKIKAPAATPISRERMAEFQAMSVPLLSRLQGSDSQQAKAEPDDGGVRPQ